MFRHIFFGFITVLLVIPALSQSDDYNFLSTPAAESNYLETTRYNDAISFLELLAGESERMFLTSFGYSVEGRKLPLLVYGDVADYTAQSVRESGKLRVLVQANIHAGEVCGKEALLNISRSLLEGDHAEWADSLVILMIPIYNVDGNERIKMDQRGQQFGPLAGMGQRPNADGLDLNRDYMKLDSPEARSLVHLIDAYDPEVIIDLHTTNGTYHGYHLTYAPPLIPNTAPGITDFLWDNWLPAVTTKMKDNYDEAIYHYGNIPPAGMANVERGWYTFSHQPRFGNNYAGLRNRMAILSEAYSYLSFAERVATTEHFVIENLDFAAQNASKIKSIVVDSDARNVPGNNLSVRATWQKSDHKTEILLGEVETVRNPFSGAELLKRLPVRRPENMFTFTTFTPTELVKAPETYLIPAEWTAVIDRLNSHGIWMDKLPQNRTLNIERFVVDSTTSAGRTFQNHNERTFYGKYESARVEIPAGTWVVSLTQPLARLAFYLLEPRSDDGFVNWNFFDSLFTEEATVTEIIYPVLRSHEMIVIDSENR